MVCYGPSKGCKTCRARKIKCDEGRPSCHQCTKSKRVCPGYDRATGVSFRDETRQTEMRADKKRRSESVNGILFQQAGSIPSSHTSKTAERSGSISSAGSGSVNGSRKYFSIAPPGRYNNVMSVAQSHSLDSERTTFPEYEIIAHTPRRTPSLEYDPDTFYASRGNSRAGSIPGLGVIIDPALTECKTQCVPQGLSQDPEQQSLCFFMTKFVQTSRQEEIWGGCLEVLPTLYNGVNSQSALCLATTATAMGSIAWNPGYAQYKPVSLSKYVSSLKLINDAVQDPKESKSDSVLMAVLMLGFYENIKSLTLQRSARESHTKGAVALIKARDPKSFHSKASARLYLAVRAQVLGQCIESADPKPLEAFLNATQGAIPPDFAYSCADHLVMLSMELPNLRLREQQLLKETDPEAQRKAAAELLKNAQDQDTRIASWSVTLPQDFIYQSLPLHTPSRRGEFTPDIYPHRMDIYNENTMASTWNTWRTARIYLLRIIMSCADTLEPPQGLYHPSPDHAGALVMIQQLVDDICSSIPYHLGHHKKRASSPGFADYPHPPGSAKWPDNFAASGAVGGWLMMAPLSFACRLDCIPSSQREWMLEYLTTFMRDPRDMEKGIVAKSAS